MKIQTLAFATVLALASTAFAAPIPIGATSSSPESSAYPHAREPHLRACEKDASKCQADAAKFDSWCSANADKCTELKAWVVKRAEYCKANAQKCEEHRQQMEERRAQFCQQDPSKPHCTAMRANKQPGDDDQSDDQMPPPPPSA
jgi:hypothetical protein